MFKKIFLFFVLISLSSCFFIAKTIYGIKSPKPETPEKIGNWLSKRHLPIDSLTLDSSVMSPYEHGGKVNFTSSPKIEIYSPQGYFTDLMNNSCSYAYLISSKRKYTVDSSKTLQMLTPTLNTINGKPIQPLVPDGKNYTYVIYWSIWSGKMSSNMINEVKSYIDSTSNNKFILVNSDLLQRWNWLKDVDIKVKETKAKK